LTKTQLVTRYGAFAAIATLANLLAQRLVLHLMDGKAGFALAVFCGTLVGLVLKYMLDKRWIFYDASRGVAVQTRKFSLYTLMGVVTTLVFWSSETLFWVLWHTDAMRELGAVLGLIVGYVIKYNLDRRFVFSDHRE